MSACGNCGKVCIVSTERTFEALQNNNVNLTLDDSTTPGQLSAELGLDPGCVDNMLKNDGNGWCVSLPTAEIVDGDLAVPGEPTETDINNYVTANETRNSMIYYIGNGTADNPDYVWYVDGLGSVTNIKSPPQTDLPIVQAEDTDFVNPANPSPAEVVAFIGTDYPAMITLVGNGTAEDPDFVWYVDNTGAVTNIESPSGVDIPIVQAQNTDFADPNNPTAAEVAAFIGTNYPAMVTLVCNGTAEDPSFVWYVDNSGAVINIESPTVPSVTIADDGIVLVQQTAVISDVGTYTTPIGTYAITNNSCQDIEYVYQIRWIKLLSVTQGGGRGTRYTAFLDKGDGVLNTLSNTTMSAYATTPASGSGLASQENSEVVNFTVLVPAGATVTLRYQAEFSFYSAWANQTLNQIGLVGAQIFEGSKNLA